ncbi:heme-copper oxidase subunit III [Ectopseudomonas guguanensis]|uniref:cytochrome c oxidase subunit 3 n=1 Tax=Ectopseudomonas guguanensis TaxID=1198456 RepID=UPI00285B7B9A|nr:cytochrome c oxidase subunit 3 [Pseudomonas guguanensis]MDR8017553.1 cytochrome c oxidase subunit 3 [Pseudomonas guguanensis]
MPKVIDVSGLSRFQEGSEAPLWWGVTMLILIEATVVASFIASYFYLRLYQTQWPPAGVAPPELLWPTLSLVMLLASCVSMWWAGQKLKQDRRNSFTLGVAISVLLASLVLLSRWQQFHAFDVRWDSSPYGSILWTISGFHFIHVVSAVIGTGVVVLLGLRGFFTRQRQIAAVVDTLYWYFVGLVWIPLYLVLYWVPRWL